MLNVKNQDTRIAENISTPAKCVGHPMFSGFVPGGNIYNLTNAKHFPNSSWPCNNWSESFPLLETIGKCFKSFVSFNLRSHKAHNLSPPAP